MLNVQIQSPLDFAAVAEAFLLAVAADLVNKLRIARVDSIGTQVFANVRACQSAVKAIIHGFSKNADVYAF